MLHAVLQNAQFCILCFSVAAAVPWRKSAHLHNSLDVLAVYLEKKQQHYITF